MRIFIKRNSLLYKLHPDLTSTEKLMGISVDKDELDKYLKEAVTSVPHLSADEQYVWAVYNAHRHPGHVDDNHPKPIIVNHKVIHWNLVLEAIIILLIIMLLFGIRLHAEPQPKIITVDGQSADGSYLHMAIIPHLFDAQLSSNGIINNILKIGGVTPTFTGSSLNINCTGGCGAAASFLDNSAFTVNTTPINVIGGYYTTGSAPSLSSGNAARARIDANSYLYVDCVTGCSASAGFADNSAFTASTTPISITGGWYSTSPTNCTTGNACAPQLTIDRKLFTQSFQGTSPWVVSANGGSFAVTGTFWQATQPVSGTFWQTTQPVSGTFWQATQPVSCATAATCPVNASQVGGPWTQNLTQVASTTLGAPTAVGTAASGNVITVNTSGTISDGTTTETPFSVVGGESNDATAQYQPIPLGTGGRSVIVEGFSGGTAVPISGTITANAGTGQFNVTCTAANCPVNMAQVNGITVLTGAGATGTGSQRETVAQDTTTIAGTIPLANNATAAGTADLAILEGIAQTSYANGTAYTQGRNVSPDVMTDGGLHVSELPAMRPASFTASKNFAATSTTDNAVLPGNATNTVLVTKVMVSCTQTTAGIVHLSIVKRSAADTSGTSAAMTAVPDDSNYSAAVSAPLSYTGTGPSQGAAVGNLDDYYLGCLAPATATPSDIYILNLWQKPIVLRGVAQQLAVTLNNAAGPVANGTINVIFKWIETATITP